jgi:hypothetical protein
MNQEFSTGKPHQIAQTSGISRQFPPKVKEGRPIPPIPARRSPLTVCIAAICDDESGSAIVTCVDGKASSFLGSQELAVKYRLVNPRWTVLTSGSQDEINLLLPLFRKHFYSLANKDETNIVPLVENIIRERREQKLDHFTQSRYSVSFEEFMKHGKERFPSDIFHADVYSISRIEIEAELIIAGFLDDGMPMLLQTDRFGSVKIMDHFATVGEGAFLAEASLLQRQHHEISPIEKTIYNVYEAKRHAERVPSVGKETVLIVMKGNGDISIIEESGRCYLDKQFDRYGPQEITDPIIIDPKQVRMLTRNWRPLTADKEDES